jgi:uncharacterized protein (DUF2147 family)
MTRIHLKLLTIASLALAGGVVASAQAQPGATASADPSAVGLWEQVDEDTGKPGGWFRIVEKNGIYEGVLVKGFGKPGEDPASWKCTKCEGAEKDAPVIGLTLIKGMKRSGLLYEDGTIMDPRDGSVYRAKMTLTPDGQTLLVRGFLGIELFGRTQTWNRLPDTAMDPQPPVRQPARAAAPNKGAPPAPSAAQAKPGTVGRPAPAPGAVPPPPR